MTQDIRWKQRLANLDKAFSQLQDAVNQRDYSELEKQGLIQCFEFTFELAWNTLKDFLEDQGYTNIRGAKDALRTAFKAGLIADGEGWMRMLEARNLMSHTYNEKLSQQIVNDIQSAYFPSVSALVSTLHQHP